MFIKEKKIRELMTEFNCTYKRALNLYVPPSPPPVLLHRHYQEDVTPISSLNSPRRPDISETESENAETNMAQEKTKSNKRKKKIKTNSRSHKKDIR